MDKIQIKIRKDAKIISYIKLIKEFDKSVSPSGISVSELKKRIEENRYVYEFDLDAGDWMYMENMTEYKWHARFLQFIKDLMKSGAVLTLYHNDEVTSPAKLGNWLHTRKEIAEEGDAESELEQMEDPAALEPYSYLWTTEQADWGVVIEEDGYTIVNTKTRRILLMEDPELNNQIAAMMIMAGNARFDGIDQAFRD